MYAAIRHVQIRRDAIWRGVCRLCWLLLILVHAPALVSLGREALANSSAPEVATWLVLCLTVFLFALKLAGVRILRFRTRRGGMAALLLAAAVAHHEVAAPAADEVLRQIPAVLLTGLVAEGLRRAHRQRRDLWSAIAQTARWTALRFWGVALTEAAAAPHAIRVGWAPFPRAPPG